MATTTGAAAQEPAGYALLIQQPEHGIRSAVAPIARRLNEMAAALQLTTKPYDVRSEQ